MGKHQRKRARSRRKKANFSNAPAEVIDQIMSFIPRPGLVNLYLVNKSLRSYAEPFLYSTVVLEWTRYQPPPIINLLQTLLRRPELLAFIRTLVLQGNEPLDVELPSLKPTGYRVQSYMPIIQKLKLPFTDIWVQKLRDASRKPPT
ncbi:unnamed protein product [Clonostachys solani]|uniref:F-box domain-containing protein n=1 Tax=Clonostachys solani TaxID=160281 RepID=A0A9P0EN97_9HYPO|nr:unnamed protein product [Clonostachys solani]